VRPDIQQGILPVFINIPDKLCCTGITGIKLPVPVICSERFLGHHKKEKFVDLHYIIRSYL
jgi:hypothetical protein